MREGGLNAAPAATNSHESSPGPRGFQDVSAKFSNGRAAAITGQLTDLRCDLSRSPMGAIVMHMPTLEIDKALLAKAQQLTGLRRKAAVLNAGLEALIARESGRQLIALGATEELGRHHVADSALPAAARDARRYDGMGRPPASWRRGTRWSAGTPAGDGTFIRRR